MFQYPYPGIMGSYAMKQGRKADLGIFRLENKVEELESQGKHREAEALQSYINHLEEDYILPAERLHAVMDLVGHIIKHCL